MHVVFALRKYRVMDTMLKGTEKDKKISYLPNN